MTTYQPGYYLLRNRDGAASFEFADNPKDASKKIFGKVLAGKQAMWKYFATNPAELSRAEMEVHETDPLGWSPMDNRGGRNKAAAAPGGVTEPSFRVSERDTAALIAKVAAVIERHLAAIETFAAKYERLKLVGTAQRILALGTELETDLADVIPLVVG